MEVVVVKAVVEAVVVEAQEDAACEFWCFPFVKRSVCGCRSRGSASTSSGVGVPRSTAAANKPFKPPVAKNRNGTYTTNF